MLPGQVFTFAGEASEGSGKREGRAVLWPGGLGEDPTVVPPEVGGEQGEEELHPRGQEGDRLQPAGYSRGTRMIFQ